MRRLIKFLREAHIVAVEALVLILFLIWAYHTVIDHLK
jgi:hypothetical protein